MTTTTTKRPALYRFHWAQDLDNARVKLFVNGMLTEEQSREVRRKIMRAVREKQEKDVR